MKSIRAKNKEEAKVGYPDAFTVFQDPDNAGWFLGFKTKAELDRWREFRGIRVHDTKYLRSMKKERK